MRNRPPKAYKSKSLLQGSHSVLSAQKNQKVVPADACTSYAVYCASVPGLAVVR